MYAFAFGSNGVTENALTIIYHFYGKGGNSAEIILITAF